MNKDETKISTELNLALQLPYSERVKSMDLNVGYNESLSEWELIIRYSGDLSVIADRVGFSYIELLNSYAIINIREELIDTLTYEQGIIFIEKPKKIYAESQMAFSTSGRAQYRGYIEGFSESCMEYAREYGLTGKGVLIAIIDSGIDINHQAFKNKNGENMIYHTWDEGGTSSVEDLSGHGTAVSGIAAACVPDAGLVIIRLNPDYAGDSTRTTSLMRAIDYAVRYAKIIGLPMVINLSFGNNYGSHNGSSILETYIASLSGTSRLSIAVGMGNDADSRRHISKNLKSGRNENIEIYIPEYTTGINIQLWYSYSDDIRISIITPAGITLGPFSYFQEVMTYSLSDMKVQVINGYPTPINQRQETYIALIPDETYIGAGIWSIRIEADDITDGLLDAWLPVSAGTTTDIAFLTPDPDVTLTIPASAAYVTSVGAYNQKLFSYASFSGRGYTTDGRVKPEIVAPGVNINVPVPGGGYSYVSGTSFATPFVSSACAMLMQWGITDGNDPYLYGEKLKAYLIKGAIQLPGYTISPNNITGWGALCIRNSLPV